MKMHEQFEERRRMGDVINILFVSLLLGFLISVYFWRKINLETADR